MFKVYNKVDFVNFEHIPHLFLMFLLLVLSKYLFSGVMEIADTGYSNVTNGLKIFETVKKTKDTSDEIILTKIIKTMLLTYSYEF